MFNKVAMGVVGITAGKMQHFISGRIRYPAMLSNRAVVLMVLLGEMFGITGAKLACAELRSRFEGNVQEDVLEHLGSSVTACMKGYWGCPTVLLPPARLRRRQPGFTEDGLPTKASTVEAVLGKERLHTCSAEVAARVALALKAKGLCALAYRHFLEVFAQNNAVLLEERRELASRLGDELALSDCADVSRTRNAFIAQQTAIVANAVGAGHSFLTAANVYSTQATVGSVGIATAAEIGYGVAHVQLCSVLFNCVERSSDLDDPVEGQVEFRELMENNDDEGKEALQARMLHILRKALNEPTAQFTQCQLQMIEKFLTNKKNTIVVMSAGAGKSLVFGLPTSMIDRTKTSQVVLYFAPLRALVEDMAQKFERWFGPGFCTVWDPLAEYATIDAIRHGRLQAGGVKMILTTVEDMLTPKGKPVLDALVRGGFVHTIVVSVLG